MPLFYFDFGDGDGGPAIDEDGEEFPNIGAAQREACATIGQAMKDYARHNFDGRLSIRVRDEEGAILEVSAVLETKTIRK